MSNARKFTREEVEEMIEEALDKARESQEEEESGNDLNGAVRRMEKVVTSLERTVRDEKGGRSGERGNMSDMLTTFSKLNLQTQGQQAITLLTPIAQTSSANLPTGTDGLPIGGSGYNPLSNTASNNWRLLMWNINAVVFTARAALMIFIVMVTLVKWEILDLLMSGEFLGGGKDKGGGYSFDLEEIFFFQALASSGSGSGGGIFDLGGLFGSLGLFGGSSSAIPTGPVYPSV